MLYWIECIEASRAALICVKLYKLILEKEKYFGNEIDKSHASQIKLDPMRCRFSIMIVLFLKAVIWIK